MLMLARGGGRSGCNNELLVDGRAARRMRRGVVPLEVAPICVRDGNLELAICGRREVERPILPVNDIFLQYPRQFPGVNGRSDASNLRGVHWSAIRKVHANRYVSELYRFTGGEMQAGEVNAARPDFYDLRVRSIASHRVKRAFVEEPRFDTAGPRSIRIEY